MGRSQLIKGYRAFWDKYFLVCSKFSTISPRSGYPFSFEDMGGWDLMRVNQPIHFSDWLYKPSSSKRLDILVTGEETFCQKSFMVIRSTIKVNYFQVKGDVAQLIESIHYDYQEKPEDAHPLFHAQVCSDIIPEVDMVRKWKSTNSRIDRYGHLKIPTAHMNLSSVLIGIIADHSPHDFFADLLPALASIKDKIPEASCQSLSQKVLTSGSFKSFNWY